MQHLKVGRAVAAFWLMTFAYVGLLLWVDRGRGLLSGFGRLYSLLPALMLISILSYVVRYARWHWLLERAGVAVQPTRGFIAYLSGFAFTATPGKIGELLRIRYFQPMGAPASMVVSAFVFERVFDLVVVLFLAGIAAARVGVFPIAAAFVIIVLSLVFLLARFPQRVLLIAGILERLHLWRLARLSGVLVRGFAHTALWLTPLDLFVSLLAGLIAWSAAAYGFVLLLNHLELGVSPVVAFSLYPVAMLARSMELIFLAGHLSVLTDFRAQGRQFDALNMNLVWFCD